jgi:SAM-dependent methyltransferase
MKTAQQRADGIIKPIETQQNVAEALRILGQLAPRGRCVLSFDRSLLEQMPRILRELHGSQLSAAKPQVDRLFDVLDPDRRVPREIDALPALLSKFPPIVAALQTRASEGVLKEAGAPFDHWTEQSAHEDLGSVLTLQKDLGQGRHSEKNQRYGADRGVAELKNYLRSVTSAPPSLWERLTRTTFWESRIRRWQNRGDIDPSMPALSVGPRWVTEIHYFREILGFKKHIGLDLFSDDPELVKAGDMHAMPFPDNEFGFTFLKNVVDKSYDVRKLVSELVRVMAPGGTVVVDQVCAYGRVTPLGRTDIQSAYNLRVLFDAKTRTRTLVCQDIDISALGDAKNTGARRINARLALQILK